MSNEYFCTHFRSFDEIETNWTCSVCSDFVKRTKFHEKLVRHCCLKATLIPKQRSNLSKEWFDSVVSSRHCCWCGQGFRRSRHKLNVFSLFRLRRKDDISRKTRLTLLPKRQQCRNNVWLRQKNRSTMLFRRCCWCGRGFKRISVSTGAESL